MWMQTAKFLGAACATLSMATGCAGTRHEFRHVTTPQEMCNLSPTLTHLRVENEFTREMGSHLVGHEGLRVLTLNIFSKDARRDGLQCLPLCTNLQELSLQVLDLTDEDLQGIEHLSQLKILDIGGESDSSITDATLVRISGLSALTCLRFSAFTDVTDAGINELVNLPNLKRLSMSRTCMVTDRGMQLLSRMPSLEYLDIAQCGRITDVGLEYLACLPQLKHLVLYGLEMDIHRNGINLDVHPDISNHGLQFLAKAKALKSLTISRLPMVTAAGIKAFKTARPDCFVSEFELYNWETDR